ncbi:Hypothetical protein PHPALM_8650 [Phytophthora palmivora]|uniref:Uncharacterized protein n=1 Tax=Phytophthora palmivora TaxID=4796 RepID=A0A2P4Y9B7_9STRA|nr:Hypothetical protein PHPALM_8650 [Phytophthora palmivora]
MDSEHRLLNYIASVPATTSADEFKAQLSGYQHKDLRAVCSHLDLALPKKNNKKSSHIATLVRYWKGDVSSTENPKTPAKTPLPQTKMSQPKANLPHHPMPMHEARDVTQYVQEFPSNGDIDELQDQLNGCKALILRSACVLLELRPNRKNFAKPNFVTLLVNYWKDSVAAATGNVPIVTPNGAPMLESFVTPREEVVALKKRVREEVKLKAPKKKKTKSLERSGDVDDEKGGVMAGSLEKAKVVKEWASAIEILSRVDGSAESIASIRALIDGVVESAAGDL